MCAHLTKHLTTLELQPTVLSGKLKALFAEKCGLVLDSAVQYSETPSFSVNHCFRFPPSLPWQIDNVWDHFALTMSALLSATCRESLLINSGEA